ncbi:MAG: hypothetical protein GY803_32120, partial [Chloroflexi bacterium]|nr:hypothetical protein [Chloroflexota bacterium]
MMIQTWLMTPLRLLYWVFFKPLTLAAHNRRLGIEVDSSGDFSVLSVRKRLRGEPAVRRHTAQMGLAWLWGLLIFMPLAEWMRVLATPNAAFSPLNVAVGVA